MKRFVWAVVFSSLALAGCGSVTSGLNFKAPAGWAATPSILGRFQMWYKATSDKSKPQMLMLIRGQTANTMDFKKIPQVGSTDLRDQKRQTIKICGDRQAQYISAKATGKDGDMSLEMISAPVGDESYLAMYMHSPSQSADPEAETAIRSLCAARS